MTVLLKKFPHKRKRITFIITRGRAAVLGSGIPTLKGHPLLMNCKKDNDLSGERENSLGVQVLAETKFSYQSKGK